LDWAAVDGEVGSFGAHGVEAAAGEGCGLFILEASAVRPLEEEMCGGQWEGSQKTEDGAAGKHAEGTVNLGGRRIEEGWIEDRIEELKSILEREQSERKL
jgi:hypothetical protein